MGIELQDVIFTCLKGIVGIVIMWLTYDRQQLRKEVNDLKDKIQINAIDREHQIAEVDRKITGIKELFTSELNKIKIMLATLKVKFLSDESDN